MLNYITKETLDKYMKGKSIIELKDFAELFEKEFGIVIPLEEANDYEGLTEDQKRKITESIFTNKDVLDQLHKASIKRDYIKDDDEAIQIIYEARNGE